MMERAHLLLCLLHFCLLAAITEGVTCPSDWIVNPNHESCIKAYNSSQTWFEARDACSKEKATLVHMDSTTVKNFVYTSISASNVFAPGTKYWVASNDIVEEDSLRSVFGQSINYTSWLRGQPNDASQDGGPHTQNCVMDVLSASLNKQEDKACTKLYAFVCEMWNRQFLTARFTRIYLDNPALENYGLAPDTVDEFPAVDMVVCAATCLQRYFYCDVYAYSSLLRHCKLLRLYEKGFSNALTVDGINMLEQEGYKAFLLRIAI